MIKKINKISNLGLVFSDFRWNPSTPDFQKFNIIYGLNGSGKTSLTRLFDTMAGLGSHAITYEIEADRGFKFDQNVRYSPGIRVFNCDYVERNVEITRLHANPISILLGSENKELAKSIEIDQKLLSGDSRDPKSLGKQRELDAYVTRQAKAQSEWESIFTDVARTIGAAATGGSAHRTYRSPEAKSEFKLLKAKELLTDGEVAQCQLEINQVLMPPVPLLSLPEIDIDGERLLLRPYIQNLMSRVNPVLAQTVETETITRLADNQDIAGWVEQGVLLHRKHSSEHCEYCRQMIPKNRLSELLAHFNESDRRIKKQIEALQGSVAMGIERIKLLEMHDEMHLYAELRSVYITALSSFSSAKDEFLMSLANLQRLLSDKRLDVSIPLSNNFEFNFDEFLAKFQLVNEIIVRHNSKTKDFQLVKDAAGAKLRKHYLSLVFDEVKTLEQELGKLATSIATCEGEISIIKARIARNRAQISSDHHACAELNSKLRNFLGRDELTFIPHEEIVEGEDGFQRETVTGYDITRGGAPAYYLSEGEKTAIAFIYFIVHLADGEFALANTTVVIDDPISSLDSNSLFQAFSFLKNAVIDCGQVFMLTHHFDFLKLLLNWRKHAGGGGYFMIANRVRNDRRVAEIVALDKMLEKYESEYHYLFKLLKQMKQDQDGSLIRAYPVPNVARKVWDTFLTFRVPDGSSIYKKIEFLKDEGYDAQKLDSIYKFTNDQSHITGGGFDLALVSETQKVIDNVLFMIKTIDGKHFAIIDGATN